MKPIRLFFISIVKIMKIIYIYIYIYVDLYIYIHLLLYIYLCSDIRKNIICINIYNWIYYYTKYHALFCYIYYSLRNSRIVGMATEKNSKVTK